MPIEKQSQEQNHSSSFDFQTSLHQVSPKNDSVSFSQDEMLSRQEKSNEHVPDTKYTMESLCRSFLKKYCDSGLQIELASIAEEFNAKLRRVYDMTNILEGGGIIQKVEKGIYKWKGILPQNQLPIDLRNEWCSLRSISLEIKRLFCKLKKGLTCHDLYNILTNGKKNKFNPATIRRRIYECCKVFMIVGLIKKSGKCFFNGMMTEKDIQMLVKMKIQTEDNSGWGNEEVGRNHCQQMISIQEQPNINDFNEIVVQEIRDNGFKLQQREAIIRKIVNQLKSQSELEKFISDLRCEYQFKKLPNDSNHENMEKNLALNEQNYLVQKEKQQEKYQTWPQVQRNIILSPPIKRQLQFLFSPNSSFCSFPSNPVFQVFNPVQDIKGK